MFILTQIMKRNVVTTHDTKTGVCVKHYLSFLFTFLGIFRIQKDIVQNILDLNSINRNLTAFFNIKETNYLTTSTLTTQFQPIHS